MPKVNYWARDYLEVMCDDSTDWPSIKTALSPLSLELFNVVFEVNSNGSCLYPHIVAMHKYISNHL